MKSALVVIGKSLRYDSAFLNYINATIAQHIDLPDQTVYIDKNDKDLFFVLEETIARADEIIIITLPDSFNLINKVLATLGEESLELKKGMLIPSKTALIEEDSYLLKRGKKHINVLRVNQTHTLPKLLIQKSSAAKFFSVFDLDEDEIKALLEPLAQNYEIRITPTQLIDGWFVVEAIANKYGNLDHFFKSITALLPKQIIQHPDVIAFIADILESHGKTIGLAESCTGGLIAAMLTKHAGISAVFRAGVVAYGNEIKESWLGVRSSTIEQFGVVSEPCVREMLEGVMDASLSDFAIATSGIAGPGGGSKELPVGTVFVGACSREGKMRVKKLLLQGDREYIQIQSAYHALKLLLHVGEDIFLKS